MSPSESLMESYLKKQPFYDQLTNEQKTLILSRWQSKKYKEGEQIHSAADDCLGQVLILSGRVRTYILSEEGREITLFVLHPDDTCVLSAACAISQVNFETHMVAEEDTEMLVLGAGVVSKLAQENIHIRCYIYELLTKRFSTVMWVMQEILFKGFDRRLATFLISECERTGSNQIRMTHEQIALYTNSAREVVARMLKRFAYDGIVDYKRGVITVINMDALYDLE